MANEKSLLQISTENRDSVLEKAPGEFKPQESSMTTLGLISMMDEVSFVNADNPVIEVKWIISVLLLLLGQTPLVNIEDLDTTWKNAKTFLSEKTAMSGLGRLNSI